MEGLFQVLFSVITLRSYSNYNLFTPKSDHNFKFPLQPQQKYNIKQYEEPLGFSQLSQMKDDYTTNTHYLIYTFLT